MNRILDKALALEHDDRSALVTILLDSLETDIPAPAANNWADEIGKRKSELLSGATRPIPWSTVKARIQDL